MADTVPGEVDTADNIHIDGWIIVTLIGDVNGDGTVNILDAIHIARAFGAKPSDPYWNPNADINGDGVVNIIDAISLAGYWGETI